MDKIITITEEKYINISKLKRDIIDLENEISEMVFLNVPDSLPDYAEELVLKENEKRDLIKADMEDRLKRKKEKLNSYNG